MFLFYTQSLTYLFLFECQYLFQLPLPQLLPVPVHGLPLRVLLQLLLPEVCLAPAQASVCTTLPVPSLTLQAGNVLLDRMEAAAILLGDNSFPASSLGAITDYLTSHLQGVQSSSIRQALLKQILSGQFQRKSGYKGLPDEELQGVQHGPDVLCVLQGLGQEQDRHVCDLSLR